MSDLISRQAAIDEIHRTIFDFFDIVEDDNESPITYKDEKLLELNKAITQRIRQLPSVERKGKWINRHSGDGVVCLEEICSECGVVFEDEPPNGYNFCPNCGADMRGEEDE